MKNYNLVEKYYLRTPTLPWNVIDKLLNENSIEGFQENLIEITKNKFVQSALLVASPILYDRWTQFIKGDIQNKEEKTKILLSITKYVIRMGTRCTPFGLFSANSIGSFSNKNNVKVPCNSKGVMAAYLDSELLYRLKEVLFEDKRIWYHLDFYTNTCIYSFNNRLRYVNSILVRNEERRYEISSVISNDILAAILEEARTGIKLDQIISSIENEGYNYQESKEYAEALVRNQILVSELEPSIVGEHYTEQLRRILSKLILVKGLENIINLRRITEILQIPQKIKNIKNPLKIKDFHDSIEQKAKEVGIDNIKFAFQIDFSKKLINDTLSYKIPSGIRKGLEILNRIALNSNDSRMNQFKEKFRGRFENKMIPLLTALDPDIGIKYADDSNDFLPLLETLESNRKLDGITENQWSDFSDTLFDKVIDSIKSGKKNIQITDEDVKELSSNWDDTFDSLAVMCNLVQEPESNSEKILIHGTRGSSATNILNRFTFLGEDFDDLVKEIFEKEQKNYDYSILCEVAHLPNYTRSINVLHRKNSRKFLIPFLTNHKLNIDKIPLDDLYLFMSGGKLFLWSKSLGQEIIPRLSTAHIYSIDAHPIYHFLGALQTQNKKTSVEFAWAEIFQRFVQLPRLSYKNVILKRATWFFKEKHLEFLKESKTIASDLEKFREIWSLPRRFTLANRDNELLIDLENSLSQEIFTKEIRTKKTITIYEFLKPAKIVVDENSNYYSNETILFFTKQEIKLRNYCPQLSKTIRRTFIPFNNTWLYLKIYSGTKTAEMILVTMLLPMVEELKSQNLIKAFFYIRYFDPEYHLRIRLRLKKSTNLDLLYSYLHKFFKRNDNLIHNIQIDSYEREIERYGSTTMEFSEKWFCEDSYFTLKALDLVNSTPNGEDHRWIFCLLTLHDLLNYFELDYKSRIEIIEERIEGNEYVKEANKSYRQKAPIFISVLENKNDNPFWKEIYNIREDRFQSIKGLISNITNLEKSNSLDVSVKNLIQSYMHMSVNRICLSNPNLHEIVLCVYLHKYYKSQLAKK